MPYFKALDSRDQGKFVIAHRQEKWGRYHTTSAPPPSSTAWPWTKLWQLFTSRRGARDFLFSETSWPVLGPTQSLVRWVPVLFPGDKNGRGVKLTTDFRPIPRLRMNGALYLYSYICLQGLDRYNLAYTSRCNTPFSISGLVVVICEPTYCIFYLQKFPKQMGMYFALSIILRFLTKCLFPKYNKCIVH